MLLKITDIIWIGHCFVLGSYFSCCILNFVVLISVEYAMFTKKKKKKKVGIYDIEYMVDCGLALVVIHTHPQFFFFLGTERNPNFCLKQHFPIILCNLVKYDLQTQCNQIFFFDEAMLFVFCSLICSICGLKFHMVTLCIIPFLFQLGKQLMQ